MARKYIVASATIVRITAEILSVLILRDTHQAMTRNADNSKISRVQPLSGFHPSR